MAKGKPEKLSKSAKQFANRHNGMLPDSYEEIPKTRRHGSKESLGGTLAELKSVFGRKPR